MAKITPLPPPLNSIKEYFTQVLLGLKFDFYERQTLNFTKEKSNVSLSKNMFVYNLGDKKNKLSEKAK